jgi:uncharacterized repeat protein (TIGR04138 family)
MNSSDATFWDAVDDIRVHDERLSREAYGFVVAAVGWTVHQLPAQRRDDPVRRHLSGAELLRGMSVLARREFGVLAGTVFREWGIRSNEDVARLVFQLIEHGCLSAQPEDSLEDFVAAPDVLDSLAAGGAPLGASHPGGDEILPGR